MIRYYILFLVTSAVGIGQVTPTRIGHHQMGETLQGWLAISHELDNMDAICHSGKHGLEGKVYKENCKRLESIRDGKQNVIDTSESNRHYTWHFDEGKLSAVRIDVPDPSLPVQAINVREEIESLTQAYGKPSSVKTVPYHNAYGVTLDCSELYWTMADGTQIAAVESMNKHDDRVLVVVLAAKGAIQTTQKPNPYKE